MSGLFRVSFHDLLKGLVVAVFSTVITTVIAMIQQGGLVLRDDSVQMILSVAVVSALSYLSKQFVTDDDGKIMGKL